MTNSMKSSDNRRSNATTSAGKVDTSSQPQNYDVQECYRNESNQNHEDRPFGRRIIQALPHGNHHAGKGLCIRCEIDNSADCGYEDEHVQDARDLGEPGGPRQPTPICVRFYDIKCNFSYQPGTQRPCGPACHPTNNAP